MGVIGNIISLGRFMWDGGASFIRWYIRMLHVMSSLGGSSVMLVSHVLMWGGMV